MQRLIIESQNHPLIFERFCAALLSKSENVTLVTTAFNYDRGTDVRSVQPTRGSHTLVLCVTLTNKLDGKVSADIMALTKRARPETIYYCSSVPLTEDAIFRLTQQIKDLVNYSVIVKVLGSVQLSEIAQQYPDIFTKFFQAEIRNIEDIFDARALPNLDPEARGLRLALMVHGSSDARQLREQMSEQMILDALSLGEKTIEGIATRLSKDLSLTKGINAAYVAAVLKGVSGKDLARLEGAQWLLTKAGEDTVNQIPPAGAANLLEGRKRIRQAIEGLISRSLADSQYDRLWTTLIEGFGEILFSNGMGIITAIDSFLGREGDLPDQKPLEELLKQVSSRVAAIFVSPEVAVEVTYAIKDVFTERSGPAFEWLSAICERFVILCCLGFETSSSEELRGRIVRSYLVVDTDIALTILSPGESDHRAVEEVITAWKQLGGRFFLATPVLEEVAYHAWISDRDFQSSQALLGTLRGADIQRYAYNAFVRGFHAVSKNRNEAKYWNDYIGQYRGSSAYDYSNVRKQLSGILGPEILTEGTDESFQAELSSQVLEISRRQHSARNGKMDEAEEYRREKEMSDKAARDGQLLASIAAARDIQERLNSGSTVVLLSSSTKIRAVAMRSKGRFGPPDPVLSMAALTYMISLLPNTRMGPETLRRALFEFGRAAKLNDCGKLAVRVIKGAGVHKLPWASRNLLCDRLDKALEAEAKATGTPARDLKRAFADGATTVNPTSFIVTALTQTSVPTNSELELAALRKQLEAANDEIAVLRRGSAAKPSRGSQ